MNPTAFNLMRESECEIESNLEDQKMMSVWWECVCVWFQMKSVGVLRGNSCGRTLMTISHTQGDLWKSPFFIWDWSLENNLNIRFMLFFYL